MKELLEQYAACKAAIKEQEEILKTIQGELLEILEDDIEYDIGQAVITKVPGRAKWTYSNIIQDMEKTLKKKKKEEEQTGIALKGMGDPYLVCRFQTQ